MNRLKKLEILKNIIYIYININILLEFYNYFIIINLHKNL